ncbi:MAG: Uncharacterised protein [Rhodospirillaceae bacterium]|nr:MAG: Uncharacterised protein [Rhodospirillaceae bacterium]
MGAEPLAQRLVQQVGGRMVTRQRCTVVGVDREGHSIANANFAFDHLDFVHPEVA